MLNSDQTVNFYNGKFVSELVTFCVLSGVALQLKILDICKYKKVHTTWTEIWPKIVK